jgi:mono/diheme cytochrome c family protein
MALGFPAWAAEPAPPDPLFTQWCARCHNINGMNTVCPDLSTIGLRQTEGYILQSIVDPNAYIVPGFPRDVMPNFAQTLKPEEIVKLVAYLMSLKGQTADPNVVGKKVQW